MICQLMLEEVMVVVAVHIVVVINLQEELFVPNRIEIRVNGFRSLLRFPDLDIDVGVAGACLVLSYQSLGTYN